MYYLLNQTNQIIAADEHLLTLCGVSHIDELTAKIILGDTTFTLSEESLTINHNEKYTVSKTSLSSMLGELTLVTLEETAGKEESIETLESTEVTIPKTDFLQDTDDASIEDITLEEKEEALLDLDEDFILIKPEEEPETSDILLPEESLVKNTLDREEILIDIQTISQEMGLSEDDYNTFLQEYIDTALALESDLQSDDESKQNNAISTLSQLGDVLRLPIIDGIIKTLSSTPKEAQKELIASFYDALSKLTTTSDNSATVKQEEEKVHFELFDMPLNEPEVEQKTEKKPVDPEASFGTINLDDVKPIHFDFQLEEAANDLSLPVELIEEFVNDFIEQAHIETKKMLEAYEAGDLDTIQKIGHLLKGASSNLRINPLSDTLYQIQFCEDPSQLEGFIREYWGHFLSFEIQINALAK